MQKYLILIFFSLSACVSDKIQAPVSIQHLESLYELNPEKVSLDSLQKEYGYFWEVYREHILSLPNDSSFADALSSFQQDSNYQKVYADVKNTFADFKQYEQELTTVIQRYNHHFPSRIIPRVVTFYGAFNYPVVNTDSVIGIGLDMFLGKELDYYQKLVEKYPSYMHQQFQPNYMTALVMKGWLETEYPTMQQNFLSQMVQQGRVQYVLAQLLPNTPDSVLMGYTKSQIEWCEASEFSIWQFFIQEDLLYTNKYEQIIKYLQPAPFSGRMPKESPGRVAVWTGWQIVKAYMNRHPSTTLQELMAIPDAQLLLNESKYKP
tara:strand:+ start:1115 stop:2074 length:960 start_codon:yes stop_codon:yes gene_type:complete